MPDRELLPLADGSRWGDDRVVVDASEDALSLSIDGEMMWMTDYRDMRELGHSSKNAIALLRRAGLLDELMKKVWDDGYSSGRADGLNDEIELTQNPYRKVANGETR